MGNNEEDNMVLGREFEFSTLLRLDELSPCSSSLEFSIPEVVVLCAAVSASFSPLVLT